MTKERLTGYSEIARSPCFVTGFANERASGKQGLLCFAAGI